MNQRSKFAELISSSASWRPYTVNYKEESKENWEMECPWKSRNSVYLLLTYFHCMSSVIQCYSGVRKFLTILYQAIKMRFFSIILAIFAEISSTMAMRRGKGEGCMLFHRDMVLAKTIRTSLYRNEDTYVYEWETERSYKDVVVNVGMEIAQGWSQEYSYVGPLWKSVLIELERSERTDKIQAECLVRKGGTERHHVRVIVSSPCFKSHKL